MPILDRFCCIQIFIVSFPICVNWNPWWYIIFRSRYRHCKAYKVSFFPMSYMITHSFLLDRCIYYKLRCNRLQNSSLNCFCWFLRASKSSSDSIIWVAQERVHTAGHCTYYLAPVYYWNSSDKEIWQDGLRKGDTFHHLSILPLIV